MTLGDLGFIMGLIAAAMVAYAIWQIKKAKSDRR